MVAAIPSGPVLTLQQLEKRAIADAVRQFGPKEAAKRLGITRQAMWLKRRSYGLIDRGEKISTDCT